MNTSWQTHLQQSGADFENHNVKGFSQPDKERQQVANSTIIAPLTHYGMISATGDEAEEFLQNQLSNDIRQVDEHHSQLSSYCSPKGRMLASFRIFKFNAQIQMRLRTDTLEATLKRLTMFIMRSQVTLEDNSDQFASFGLCGNEAENLLSRAGLSVPEKTNDVAQNQDLCVIRIPGTRPRFEVHGMPDAIITLWDSCAGQANPVGTGAWLLEDIWSGLPDISANTVEAFVPQMANLHAIGGVSFKKGCYPGQEVVARMQYLGKLKRRMFRAHVDTEQLPQAGDNLYSPASSDSVGKIMTASLAPEGGVDMLAVLQIAQAEQHAIHLGSATGPQLEFIDLPYQVPLEREK
jgi:hypothetical protein